MLCYSQTQHTHNIPSPCSHLRAITCVATHSEDPLVVTGGADHVVKVWWLPAPRATTQYDVPPVATFRGHTGAVRAVELLEHENHCFSASDDGSIRCWMLPEEDFDPTQAYESSEMYQLLGHVGPVTALSHARGPHMLSAGADNTCRSGGGCGGGGFFFWGGE